MDWITQILEIIFT